MTHHKPPCERNKWNRCPTQNSQTEIVSPTKSWQWNCYSLNFKSETLHGNFRLSSFGKAQVFCCTRYDVEWMIPGRIPHACCRKSGKTIQFPNASPIFPQDVKQHGHNSRYEQRLALKISNIHAQTLEHEEGKMKHYSFHTAWCSHKLSAPDTSWLHVVPLPTRSESLPRKAG